MKIIIITCFHQLLPRNILTPILPLLEREEDVRLVVLVPSHKKAYFDKAYQGRGAVIEGIKLGGSTRTLRDRVMGRLMHPLCDTESMRVMYRGRLENYHRTLHYYFFYLPLRALGQSSLMRRVMRWLDYRLASERRFSSVLDAYKPDLIFSADVMDKYDSELIYCARRRGIRVVSMVRSWDNLTKFGLLRAIPDHLLVWNELIKREAVEYQGVPEEKITVVGIPHYDRYTHGHHATRAEFFHSCGLDPAKKTILFSPLGAPRLRYNDADRITLEILQKFGLNVMVRFPPTNPVDMEGYVRPSNVAFDVPGFVFSSSSQLIDSIVTDEDDLRFSDELFHSDVVVCGPTTVAVDAAVFDKPIILVNFHPRGDYLDEAGESYRSVHMQYLIRSGGVRVANSQEELLSLLRAYLEDPGMDVKERKNMAHEQCGPFDGNASKRVASFLMEELHQADSRNKR